MVCRDIALGNGWLVACSLVHMGLAVALVQSHGALGLIAADAANMVLRIGFCLAVVGRRFRAMQGFRLRGLFPSTPALGALTAASAVCLASDGLLFKGSALPVALQVRAAAFKFVQEAVSCLLLDQDRTTACSVPVHRWGMSNAA